ncbi:MAG: glycosyl hydrolase 2 galactose-binding domain-containing protein [Acidobacteriaceae bacterium]
MPKVSRTISACFLWTAAAVFFLLSSGATYAQAVLDAPAYGPYNGVFLPDGNSLQKPMDAHDPVLQPNAPWTVSYWFQSAGALPATTLIAGVGDPQNEDSRFFGVEDGKLIFRLGKGSSLMGPAISAAKPWHFAAATYDGTEIRLYSDGEEVASGKLLMGTVSAELQMAPEDVPLAEGKHFGGKVAGFAVYRTALSSSEIKTLSLQIPDFSVINFEEASKSWPVQTRGQAGYRAPQDPSLMPHSAAPFSRPVAKPLPPAHTTLQPVGANTWELDGGWQLIAAPKVHADGAAISESSFASKNWMAATVPGTVLSTMVDRGIYPDPYYGLNNLAIPESLNKQDYWYRVEFSPSKAIDGRNLMLTFNGINYAAEVWLNGKRLGDIKGAFIRGKFDVTGLLQPGQKNVLAVRVSPPPHPGIPQEQSIKGGPGENGGIMCLDGPTFVATEGWDWIPGIRDRDTGIWQNVTLTATRQVKLGDIHVVTVLPLPQTDHADVDITVPVTNLSSMPVQGSLTASFEQVSVTKKLTLPPGESTIKLTPAEYAQLTVQHPRLWWPNGYGKPNLYHLKVSFDTQAGISDTKQLHFGIREITYELSLYDATGHLRRVEISPTMASLHGEKIVDVSHEGMRQIPDGWVATLAPGAAATPAVRPVSDTEGTTDLVLKVNGVRIAARGGNWGMDDAMKRVSRAHLEPYFRLQRDAHLDIIRNWVGQNTEETFYDLADEYGMMVWNDFWDSTQNYNLEPEDPALFLKNARDTILRFRNHPSIVLWCGRNEGVPQPIINQGLDKLIRALDGTRYYSPSSNQVNLRPSGPYSYRSPETYYTINRGFSVELGIPSMSTLESFRASIPKADQWPISDDWAYHDWHQRGNGDVHPFMQHLDEEFGAPTSLPDFERKAQMMNYVDHRAIFEGFNAHLWKPNSGRMLWMTQPAWPSTMWQILSSDYDTQASFYGVMKACEPVHVQLDLTDYSVAVVNTTTEPLSGLTVKAEVYSLANKLLFEHQQQLSSVADAVTPALQLDLKPLMQSGMILVRLKLFDASGKEVSRNLYWLGEDDADYRQLDALPHIALAATATSSHVQDEVHVRVQLQNDGTSAALMSKLTLENASDKTRILPAYLTDNYVSLLPGEKREIEIDYPASAAKGTAVVALRGWNVSNTLIPIVAH